MTAARRRGSGTSILMYHSISEGPGPLAIAPGTFRMQMEMLDRCGCRVVALRDFIASRGERRCDDRRTVVLTFDDGYQDFVDVALPEVESRGWGSTLFLAAGLVGAPDGWDPDGTGRKPMLGWEDAARASRRGVELGAHAVTHADLTRLPLDRARDELAASQRTIAQKAESAVTSFAPPYGRSTPALRAEIARLYECSAGTTMARAGDRSERYDLPRIDMWYFRDPGNWRRFLEGSLTYFTVRRLLRHARLAMRVAGRS